MLFIQFKQIEFSNILSSSVLLQCLHLHRKAWQRECSWMPKLSDYQHVCCSFFFRNMIYNAKTKWNKSTGVCRCSSVLISLSYLADSDQSLTLRSAGNIRQYIQNLKVIDNQKKLTQLSRAIERWDTARLPFFSPSCSILENKSDWWNPWSPYVWLIGVNSHKRHRSVLRGLCKAEHWLGKRWQVTVSIWCLIRSVLIWLLWLICAVSDTLHHEQRISL